MSNCKLKKWHWEGTVPFVTYVKAINFVSFVVNIITIQSSPHNLSPGEPYSLSTGMFASTHAVLQNFLSWTSKNFPKSHYSCTLRFCNSSQCFKDKDHILNMAWKNFYNMSIYISRALAFIHFLCLASQDFQDWDISHLQQGLCTFCSLSLLNSLSLLPSPRLFHQT